MSGSSDEVFLTTKKGFLKSYNISSRFDRSKCLLTTSYSGD